MIGGAILNFAIEEFPNIAMFQPVINGVAGNLVGIQVSIKILFWKSSIYKMINSHHNFYMKLKHWKKNQLLNFKLKQWRKAIDHQYFLKKDMTISMEFTKY